MLQLVAGVFVGGAGLPQVNEAFDVCWGFQPARNLAVYAPGVRFPAVSQNCSLPATPERAIVGPPVDHAHGPPPTVRCAASVTLRLESSHASVAFAASLATKIAPTAG